jgi:hypothetical protein
LVAVASESSEHAGTKVAIAAMKAQPNETKSERVAFMAYPSE